MPASWTGWLDFLDDHAFSSCNVFQGVSEKAVRDAINLLNASFASLTVKLSEISRVLP